jgi:hypothetical protein
MTQIALVLAVFMLATPVASYGGSSESTPLAGQGGAKAGQETIRSGIAGQAVKEKEKAVKKRNKQDSKKSKNAKDDSPGR